MILKSFDEMNAEQQFAYKMGYYEAIRKRLAPLPSSPRWCLTHSQPAGPIAYAYCAEGPTQDDDCDIRTVTVTAAE